MRSVILPQNPSPVVLLFKDGGGLPNHPLSCHPQEVFGNPENRRKTKKMKEKESGRKAYRPLLCIFHPAKNRSPLYKGLSFYTALKIKIQKYPQGTLIHIKGKNGKEGGKMTKKSKVQDKIWHSGAKISYRGAKLLLLFCSSSAPLLLLIFF